MTYRQLYFNVFNAVTAALEELDRGRIIAAMDLLKRAQQAGENYHLETDIIPDHDMKIPTAE